MAGRVATIANTAKNEVYRGYMPIGLPQHRPRERVRHWWKVEGRPRVTIYPKLPADKNTLYSNEPEYPPLNDGSMKGLSRQLRVDWYESLKLLPTAELKMQEITRHGEHYIAQVNNWAPNYNSLPMIKYLTRTHLVESLPLDYQISPIEGLQKQNQAQEELYSTIENMLLEQLALDLYESKKMRPSYVSKSIEDGNRSQYVSDRVIQNLVTSIKNTLACETNNQLFDYQYDNGPAIRAWWYHSGFCPPNNKPFYKSRKDDDGNINQMIQMNGHSALNIRSDCLFEPILPMDNDLVRDENLIQPHSYSLKFYGAQYKFKKPVTLPGFWPEDTPKYDCPHTCFLTTDCLTQRYKSIRNRVKSDDDQEDCLNGQAIMTAFGWLNSLACYHGFTPFQPMEYPLTCQVVTTNGRDWLFNVYQFNSHTFHRDLNIRNNNICWSSGAMRLYERYEMGQFKNVNKDVIRLLVKFLSNQTSPSYTEQLNLRPYISNKVDMDDEELDKLRARLRCSYEQRVNRATRHHWSRPMWEHIFFRHKKLRNRITHMKALWHAPVPKYPKMFE